MHDAPATSQTDDRTPLALAAGLVAALLGGLIWAAIVLVTDYEVGWVAWGIGALVGFAMAAVTRTRGRAIGLAAAALALVGLIAGKGFVVAGSAGSIADELMESPEYLAGAVAWEMYGAGELEPATIAAIDATDAAGDTLSDALWADMLAQGAARLNTMSDTDRRALAEEAAAGFIGQIGLVDGIMAQLSGFDLLWLLLAMGTAYKIMEAREETEMVVAEAQTGTDGGPGMEGGPEMEAGPEPGGPQTPDRL